MSESAKKKQRPLSPHLQVYRLPVTAVMSILHRVTGVALTVGLVGVVWMLVAAATSEDAYNLFLGYAGSIIGKLFLFGWSVALFYHACNGIRYLFWDVGYLFELKNAFRAGYVVLFMTAVLTALLWWSVCPIEMK